MGQGYRAGGVERILNAIKTLFRDQVIDRWRQNLLPQLDSFSFFLSIFASPFPCRFHLPRHTEAAQRVTGQNFQVKRGHLFGIVTRAPLLMWSARF